ncbi:hypothetical protein SK128_009752 [Halocaridina rubra]|uniref:Uncharacterized protein n=1 Tax=Halocaridina rubra TaxID=373956 RepID=A0AAN9A6P9_HALRR
MPGSPTGTPLRSRGYLPSKMATIRHDPSVLVILIFNILIWCSGKEVEGYEISDTESKIQNVITDHINGENRSERESLNNEPIVFTTASDFVVSTDTPVSISSPTSYQHNFSSDTSSPKSTESFATSSEPLNSQDNLGQLGNYIIERDNLRYLDISNINKTELKLRNLQSQAISGITVSKGQNCKIENLVIDGSCEVNANLIKCQSLKNITFLGRNWVCSKDWSWLQDLPSQGKHFHSQAHCVDIRMPEGIYYRRMDFIHGVNRLRELLRSTHEVFRHLKNLENLEELNLGGNHLDTLPYLKQKYFQKLTRLFLHNNSIHKLDVEAFESIVSREDIVVDLRGHIFPCDCDAHFFMFS